jgi:nucleotide-binding universal stress UspA family protein
MPIALKEGMAQPMLIAAVDLGPLTGRVLYHAAGFARLLNLKLRVVHVGANTSPELHEQVLTTCLREGPYQMNLDEGDVVVRRGQVSAAIVREAKRADAPLIVMGARGRSAVTSLLLGSTSQAVLRQAATPVLLVPPTDIDIVRVDDSVTLTSGPIIAAVDLQEQCRESLVMASLLASVGSQPLVLMTVAKSRTPDDHASLQLRERGQLMYPKKPTAVIVRRGDIPEEIARCASAEHSGLVVMGLRGTPKCQPGTIAGAVLKTKKAFVLAVPGC